LGGAEPEATPPPAACTQHERTGQSINHAEIDPDPIPSSPTRPQESRAREYKWEGGGGAASGPRGERLRSRAAGSEVEAALLRSGSEPGGRSLSTKSGPEDAPEEDSVELRAGSSDMAGARPAWSAYGLSGRGWRRAGGRRLLSPSVRRAGEAVSREQQPGAVGRGGGGWAGADAAGPVVGV